MWMKISEQEPLCPHHHNTPTKCDTFAASCLHSDGETGLASHKRRRSVQKKKKFGRGNFLELGVRGHRDLGYSIIVRLSVYGQRRVCLNPQMHIFAIGAIFLLCRFSACLPLCPEKTKTLWFDGCPSTDSSPLCTVHGWDVSLCNAAFELTANATGPSRLAGL